MLSVVYLAILYAVLTIALGFEWGRILERLATDAASYDAVAEGSEVDPSGSLR